MTVAQAALVLLAEITWVYLVALKVALLVKELLVQQLRPVQPVQAATLTAATQQQAEQAA